VLNRLFIIIVLITFVSFSGCASSNDYESDDISTDSAQIDEAVSSGQDSTSSYNGYPCTGDCSGHEAGHQWAENNSISDDSDCNGNSESFNEGCRSYIEENGSSSSEDSSTEAEE
jgi:hypothetical protein